ncbi:MAG: hypothetical protein WCL71_16820, partial [Deltaproteobacteria bacterium]
MRLKVQKTPHFPTLMRQSGDLNNNPSMKTSSNNSSLTTISGNSLKIPNDINQTRSSIKHLALAAAAAMLANAAHLRRAACLAALVLGLGGFVPTAHADYASTALGYSPVGYWRLNETTPSADPAISYNTGTGGAALNGAYVNYPT